MRIAQKGTIMNSTMVLWTDISRRTLWVDVGSPACHERLVTLADAHAHRVGGANNHVTDER